MTAARDAGFDNLRSLGVVLVFLLHWSAAYMRFAPSWWYVVNPEQSLGFTALSVVLDATAIPLLFVLSGYFLPNSLARRGLARFASGRLMRLGVPAVLGVLLVAPPTTWLYFQSRELPVGLWSFWTTGFWGPAFNHGVYWFLGVLLVFNLVAASLLHLAGPPLTVNAPPPAHPFPVAALLVPAALTVGMASSVTLDTWEHHALFSVQPARLPLYGCFFALGLYVGRSGWKAPVLSCAAVVRAGLGLLLCVAMYVAVRFHPDGSLGWRVMLALAYSAIAGQFVRFALLAAPRLFGSASPGARSLAANAFGIYLLHLPILLLATLAARPLDIGLWPKALAVGVLSFGATWALSAALRNLGAKAFAQHTPGAA